MTWTKQRGVEPPNMGRVWHFTGLMCTIIKDRNTLVGQ